VNKTNWTNTFTYDDVYTWNCLGYDIAGNYNWSAEGNYSITIDTTPPFWTDNSTNITNSTVRFNDSLMFGINWTDNIRLDSTIFSWNGSLGGNLTNDSASYCGNLSCVINVSKVINLTRGKQFCWKWYANDTANNRNETDQWCFIVNNTPPTQSTPIVNSTYGTNYTDEDLYCYNQSFYDIDGDNLTALYRWYNESGPMPGQTNWNLSYELTVVNHNYTCVVWAYDGFDNSTPANATITIREGLIINITSPRNGTTINYSYHVLFNFTVSMVANCSYKLDDGDYVSVWNVTNYRAILFILQTIY